MRAVIIAMLVSSLVWADDELVPQSAPLRGHIVDQTTGVPVEGALVMISGPAGLVTTVATDGNGAYQADLDPGIYSVVFAHGKARASGKATVSSAGATLDGKLDAMMGEVIIIRDKIKPPVPPKPTNYKPKATPPYSEAAVLSDAWTKAHLLLDLDEHGNVLRYKFLKRPGYDLEKIAAKEVSKLKFDPAKDGTGKPMRSWVVWTIEWPSAGWLTTFQGTYSAMPKVIGFPPRRADAHVPCAGSGPLHLGSVHPVYKDCSKPDLRNAVKERWEPAINEVASKAR